jgi:hypothetical protein
MTVKLNVGCGDRRLPGYIGVDAVPRSAADILAPAHDIPMPDGCASELLAVHVVEHVYAWAVPALLAEWRRLLQPGGLLVLEMPDAMKCARNLIEGRSGKKSPDQLHLWGLYGDDTLRDPFMMHKAGWWFARLAPVVRATGFFDVSEHETVFHPAGRGVRDFRLEARKP